MSNLPKKNDEGDKALVSYSQMRMYKQCPKAYEYRYVEGIKGILPGRVKVGSAFDKAANEMLLQRMEDKPVDEEAGIGAALEYWNKPDADFDETDIAGDDDLMGKMMSAIREYSVIAAKTDVQYVQHYLEYSLTPDVLMIGNIDLVELSPEAGGLIIVDNKSTMKKRSGRYTHETAAIDEQLTLYAAGMSATQDTPVVGRGWNVVDIGRKTPGRIESIQVKDDDQATTDDLALRYANATLAMMEHSCETGSFAPLARGTWACSQQYCEFYNRCEYGSKNRNVIPIGNI
jgi:hypothetical protein